MDSSTVFIVVVVLLVLYFLMRGGSSTVAIVAAKPAPISLFDLHARRGAMTTALSELSSLQFFDAEDAALVEAWEKKQTGQIEELLRAGDTLNRESWRMAGVSYNHAAAAVDFGRKGLEQILGKAEPLLVQYGVDYRTYKVTPSEVLTGDAKIVQLQLHWGQKLNYTTPAAQAAGRAAAGSGSWQVALVMGIAAMAMAAINDSKLLRQLKEMEGEIEAMAEAMQGDVREICVVIQTRLLPQFDWIVRLFGQIEQSLQTLGSVEAGATDDALTHEQVVRLGMAVAEGKMLLTTKAGN